MISSEFTCKCGMQKGWIAAGKRLPPCPECGREYVGFEEQDDLGLTHIKAREVVKDGE